MKQKTILKNGVELHQQKALQLSEQKRLLEAQKIKAQESYPKEKRNLIQQKQSARENLNQVAQQIKTQQSHSNLVEKELKKYQSLYQKNLISQLDLDKVNKELLQVKNGLQALYRNQSQQQQLLQQLDGQLTLLFSRHDTKIQQLSSEILGIEQRLLQSKSVANVVLSAPVSGIVYAIQAHEGQKYNSSVPMAIILPKKQFLKVNLLVPVRAAGFIEEGQVLSVRYNAFPYQKFGTYEAKITKVPKVILLPNEILGLPVVVKW